MKSMALFGCILFFAQASWSAPVVTPYRQVGTNVYYPAKSYRWNRFWECRIIRWHGDLAEIETKRHALATISGTILSVTPTGILLDTRGDETCFVKFETDGQDLVDNQRLKNLPVKPDGTHTYTSVFRARRTVKAYKLTEPYTWENLGKVRNLDKNGFTNGALVEIPSIYLFEDKTAGVYDAGLPVAAPGK